MTRRLLQPRGYVCPRSLTRPGTDGGSTKMSADLHSWVLTPQYANHMHRFEWCGVLQFSNRTTDLPQLRPYDEWDNRLNLLEDWEAEHRIRDETGHYTEDQAVLGLDIPGLSLEATAKVFEARLGRCGVDHELRWRVP